MKYNEKIIALRKARGFTQDGFAKEMDVSRQAVYKWEIGESYPDAKKLIAIKMLFGISIDDLLDDNFDVEVELPKKTRKRTSPVVRQTEKLAKEPVNVPKKKDLPPLPRIGGKPEEAPAPVAESIATPVAAPIVEAPVAAPAVTPVAPVAAPAAEPVVAAPAVTPVAPVAAPAAEPVVAAPAPAPAVAALDADDDLEEFEVVVNKRTVDESGPKDLLDFFRK